MGRNSGGREAFGLDPKPHGVERKEGVEGAVTEFRGVELSLDDSTRHGEGGGVESFQDNLTPNGGVAKSWQDD